MVATLSSKKILALTIHLTYMYYLYVNKCLILTLKFIISDDKGNEVFNDAYEDEVEIH